MVLAATLGCRGGARPDDSSPVATIQPAAVAGYHVEGVACESCAKRIREGLMKIDGIKSVSVDVPSKRVSVEYDAAKLDAEQIRASIEGLGFKATKDDKRGSA